MALHIIFMGPPGAGKGTQAEKVAQKLGLAHIAPGDLFRQAVRLEDSLGARVKAYMEQGELVPDDITIKVILEHLSRITGSNGVVLDGFPRNLYQAQALDNALEQQNTGIDRVVYIQVDRPELVKRLSSRWLCRDCQNPVSLEASSKGPDDTCLQCGGRLYQRSDDRPETVSRRLEVYFEETAPLIAYYQKQGKLLRVNGEGGIDEVTRRIINELEITDGDNN